MEGHNQLVVRLDLTLDELGACSNALNEVLNGFAVPDFDHRIGFRIDVERLLRHIGDVYELADQDQRVVIRMDVPQSQILANAFGATFDEFGESEFGTRMGCTPAEASDVMTRLSRPENRRRGGAGGLR